MTIRHTMVDSPVGVLTLVAEGEALTGLYFDGRAPRLAGPAAGAGRERGFEAAREQLAEYFAGERQEFDLPLAPEGTAFQHRVWALLRAIPYGETRTYGGLAREPGNPGLAREVGSANGRNPLPIIVPCHRVIGAGGKLVGYGGGLDRKRFLLDLELRVSFPRTRESMLPVVP